MDTPGPPWRSAIGPSLLGIGALVLLQTLATLAQPGNHATALGALGASAVYYPPWVVFGVTGFSLLSRIPGRLEPHFLFNALSAVAGLVRSGADDEALVALAKLGDLLRYATAASRAEWVGLDQELAFVRDYLEIQRLRYGDRLAVDLRTEGDPAEIRCPPLLLQPLVENAIRHDLDVHPGAGLVRMEVMVDAAGARVRVENTARAGPSRNPGLGLGLATVGERLALRFPGAPPLQAGARGERYVVELFLPRSDDG